MLWFPYIKQTSVTSNQCLSWEKPVRFPWYYMFNACDGSEDVKIWSRPFWLILSIKCRAQAVMWPIYYQNQSQEWLIIVVLRSLRQPIYTSTVQHWHFLFIKVLSRWSQLTSTITYFKTCWEDEQNINNRHLNEGKSILRLIVLIEVLFLGMGKYSMCSELHFYKSTMHL